MFFAQYDTLKKDLLSMCGYQGPQESLCLLLLCDTVCHTPIFTFTFLHFPKSLSISSLVSFLIPSLFQSVAP